MKVKVLVSGSRSIKQCAPVQYALENSPFEPEIIVHGGAQGVDSYTDMYAAIEDIDTEVVEPNYHKYGKRAPLKRNKRMVDKVDAAIFIWDQESSGTKHTIEEVKNCGMEKVRSEVVEDRIKVMHFAYPALGIES